VAIGTGIGAVMQSAEKTNDRFDQIFTDPASAS